MIIQLAVKLCLIFLFKFVHRFFDNTIDCFYSIFSEKIAGSFKV